MGQIKLQLTKNNTTNISLGGKFFFLHRLMLLPICFKNTLTLPPFYVRSAKRVFWVIREQHKSLKKEKWLPCLLGVVAFHYNLQKSAWKLEFEIVGTDASPIHVISFLFKLYESGLKGQDFEWLNQLRTRCQKVRIWNVCYLDPNCSYIKLFLSLYLYIKGPYGRAIPYIYWKILRLW